MKIFVGWPYRTQYEWIEDYAIPLIQSYGVEVFHGKEMAGEKLGPEIKEMIRNSDAVIIFMLAVEHKEEGPPRTSNWMIQELEYAQGREEVKRIWVVRGEGVEVADEMHEKRQYKVLKAGGEMGFLVELGQVVSQWRGLTFKLKLLPQAFVECAIGQLGKKEGYECFYTLRAQGKPVIKPQKAEITPEGEELYVYAYDLPLDIFSRADVSLEVTVKLYEGGSWTRTGIKLTASEVTLQKT